MPEIKIRICYEFEVPDFHAESIILDDGITIIINGNDSPQRQMVSILQEIKTSIPEIQKMRKAQVIPFPEGGIRC